MSTESSSLIRTVTVRRTFLVRQTTDYLLEVPHDYDLTEWKENDYAGFDEFARTLGTVTRQDYDALDELDEIPDAGEEPPALADIWSAGEEARRRLAEGEPHGLCQLCAACVSPRRP
ncbi:hypothetical protein [Nocardioides sp. GXZ039]|uniref:hypothetical protein n=1 Tax=Nocardioides sp. GXZ039 TaxID=3136018 RepID=UPI0030F38F4F